MGIFKRIADLFSPSGGGESAYTYKVQCNRCGEVIEARVDLRNDLSAQYEDGDTYYYTRKVVMGEGRCFQRIEVEMTFDEKRHLRDRQIQGGKFVEEPAGG